MIRTFLPALIMVLLASCGNRGTRDRIMADTAERLSIPLSHADGFTMERQGDSLVLQVLDPWQQAEGVRYTYTLSSKMPASLIEDSHHTGIRIPVQRVVCLSTTHIGMIDFLGVSSTICGLSGQELVVNPMVRERISRNEVKDVGYGENLNYELLLQLDPDLVFAYGVNASVTTMINKLNELGIPVVIAGEYLEEEPLAKMEWVKFFAAFYGLEELAEQRFDSVAQEYGRLASLASGAGPKPKVVAGLPWQGSWYISGGKSYLARLIADAGGDYIWSSLDYSDSRPMDMEKVYEGAMQADCWLNTGDALSMSAIRAADERFASLPVFRERQLYNNNRWMNSSGGNAYFEYGVVEPQRILADLISILHPQLLPSHELKYYQQLE